MTTTEATKVIEPLKKAADTNKAFHSIALVFAMRERARFQVNVRSLKRTMKAEGYPLTTKEVEDSLTFLASLGIGKLYYGSNKKLQGLTEVKWTLQSIGRAALGEAKSVDKAHRQNRFRDLPEAPASMFPIQLSQPVPPTPDKAHKATLILEINGKPLRFPLPSLTTDQAMELLVEVNHKGGRA